MNEEIPQQELPIICRDCFQPVAGELVHIIDGHYPHEDSGILAIDDIISARIENQDAIERWRTAVYCINCEGLLTFTQENVPDYLIDHRANRYWDQRGVA